MKFLSWLLTLLVLALALCFALNNRQMTSLSLWPFGFEVQAPLYLFALGTFFGGMLIGSVIGWMSNLPHRMESRRLRRDIAGLHQKIEDISDSMPTAATKNESYDELPKPKTKRLFRRM